MSEIDIPTMADLLAAAPDLDDFQSPDLEGLADPFDNGLEAEVVARRLSLHPATVRKMFKKGLLDGFLTGPSKTRIRIYETSVKKHMRNK